MAAVDVFQMDLATVVQDISSGAPKATLKQDLQTLKTAFVDLLHAEHRFTEDTRDDLMSDLPKTNAENLLDKALESFFALVGRLG